MLEEYERVVRPLEPTNFCPGLSNYNVRFCTKDAVLSTASNQRIKFPWICEKALTLPRAVTVGGATRCYAPVCCSLLSNANLKKAAWKKKKKLPEALKSTSLDTCGRTKGRAKASRIIKFVSSLGTK